MRRPKNEEDAPRDAQRGCDRGRCSWQDYHMERQHAPVVGLFRAGHVQEAWAGIAEDLGQQKVRAGVDAANTVHSTCFFRTAFALAPCRTNGKTDFC